jgi:hypothetical protein
MPQFTQRDANRSAQLNPFDLAQSLAEQFPPPYATGFLNRAEVLKELNVPVNYTYAGDIITGSKPRAQPSFAHCSFYLFRGKVLT